MSRIEIKGRYFLLSYTVEPEGPHLTMLEDHYEDCAAITALIRGSGTCFVEGKTYILSDGDLIAVGSSELRSFHFDHEGYHERFTIYFTATLLTPLLEYELDLLKLFTAHPPGVGNKYSLPELSDDAAAILSQLCRVAAQCGEKPSLKDDAHLHLLVLELLFALHECYEKRELPEITVDNNSAVWAICRYIHDHLSENLNYESIQNELHVGRYCLSVLFRQSTGMTLTEFILQKRLLKVSELVHSGYSISKASEAAGFRNYSHFYKIFVKRKHISPQKYYAAQNAAFRSEGGLRNG